MFNVMFEVCPRADRFDSYLKLAAHLKPLLEQSDGFIDNERFASRRRAGWILSLSSWRDEKALVRWRTHAEHHRVQGCGRSEIFDDYRLRVGEIGFDSAAEPPVPAVQQRFDETQADAVKVVALIEMTFASEADRVAGTDRLIARIDAGGAAAAPLEVDVLHSIYRPGKACLLTGWPDVAQAQAWEPGRPDAMIDERRRIVRVIRDYGMRRREEAPQYHPPVV